MELHPARWNGCHLYRHNRSRRNLYWIEYRRALESQQLVSASRDGSIRYRSDFERASKERHLITDGAVWADGKVLVATEDNHVRAFDAQTGALAWDSAVSAGSGYTGQLTDTGAGVIVATYGGGLSGIDLASGEVLWTHAGETSVSTASGDIFLGERDADRQLFLTRTDSSGMDIWSELVGGLPVAVLGGETPLIVAYRSPDRGPQTVVGVTQPGTVERRGWERLWISARLVQPNRAQVLHATDGSTLGAQTVTGGYPIGFNRTSLLTPDHLLLVSQNTAPCSCLCHPRTYQQARVSGWSADAEQVFSCELPDLGEAGIEGASLYSGNLVIARRHYFTAACTSEIQPLIIEAYGVPDQELIDEGWVVPRGNPAQSRRPLSPAL